MQSSHELLNGVIPTLSPFCKVVTFYPISDITPIT